MADSVSELSQSRRAGLLVQPTSSWMYRKISSPSRPASVAQISSSADAEEAPDDRELLAAPGPRRSA